MLCWIRSELVTNDVKSGLLLVDCVVRLSLILSIFSLDVGLISGSTIEDEVFCLLVDSEVRKSVKDYYRKVLTPNKLRY